MPVQELPAPPRARPRKRGAAARKMPGWGQAGGTWTALDKLDEEAEAAAAAASGMGGDAAAQQQTEADEGRSAAEAGGRWPD
jgi:hypothetical protein